MTKHRGLCIRHTKLVALFLTVGLMAMPAMGDHPACTPDAGDCCSGNGTAGCDDPECCHDVCTFDPFCCDNTWDSICANLAFSICQGQCVCSASDFCKCPAGSQSEPEICGEDLNGGCNVDPPQFTPAAIGDTFCGSVWANDGKRDTDWYQVTVDDPDGDGFALIVSTLSSEFDGTTCIVGGLDAVPCTPVILATGKSSNNCEPGLSASAIVAAPGTYAVFVATTAFDGAPCGCFGSYTVEISGEAPPPPANTQCADPGNITLSQSNSLDIIEGNSFACSLDGGITTAENSFARAFNNIGADMEIVCVRWAIEAVNVADASVGLNIYEDTNGGVPTHPDVDLNLLATASTILPVNGGGKIYVFNFGVGGIAVTAGMNIVVELAYPDTTGISGVWPGSNPFGQTGPSYHRSVCGLSSYVDLADIGFPNMHVIMEIRGNAIDAPCPWDLDGNGMVNTNDLLSLFTQWGTDGPADFDESGTVGTNDLLILFANWGPCI